MLGDQLVYTIPQVAELLAVSKSTVYRLIDDGALEPIYVRSKARVRQSAVIRYLDAQERCHREGMVSF